jgi:hypothetical protein
MQFTRKSKEKIIIIIRTENNIPVSAPMILFVDGGQTF